MLELVQLAGLAIRFTEPLLYGPLAQLAEHLPFKQGVTGSNPVRLMYLKMRNATLAQSAEQTLRKRAWVAPTTPSVSTHQ